MTRGQRLIILNFKCLDFYLCLSCISAVSGGGGLGGGKVVVVLVMLVALVNTKSTIHPDMQKVINRPSETGAVLQTPSSLIDLLIESLILCSIIFRTPSIPNHKR